jgi:DNA-binding XRE family transcriptional regulator
VWGICSPTYAKISRRNLQYPGALLRGFFIFSLLISKIFTLNLELFDYKPALFLESSGMEQETEEILEKIRLKRIEKKISLLNLANEVGISHSHLYYIESKKVMPSIDLIVKISKSLKIPLKELLP